MVSKAAIQNMVNHADVTEEDVVVEIGAGLGFLTQVLAEGVGRVITVKFGRKLVRALNDRLGGYRNVTAIEGDILHTQLPHYNKIVANPPYAISTLLRIKLVKEGFECAVLTLQEEFVRKLIVRPNNPNYGRLTVIMYYKWFVQLLQRMSKNLFYPALKVNSYLVRFNPRKEPLVRVQNEALFHNLVTFLFS